MRFGTYFANFISLDFAFSITKYYNNEIQRYSISQSTGEYFPVQVQIYWECTGKYNPSRVGGIINRPGLPGAVLHTALSLIQSFIN